MTQTTNKLHAPFTRSIVRRSFVYLILSVTLVSAVAVAALFLWERGRLEREVSGTGNALLTNLVENTRDSISMGQPETFQRVIDDFSSIKGVVDVALFSRYGLMTYESGAETVGRPILTSEGKVHAGGRRAAADSGWGLPRRGDWSLQDLVKTTAAKKHLSEMAARGRKCTECHHTLPTKLTFDGKGRSHLLGDRYSKFFYRLEAGRQCVVCHTNWQPGKVAGYLRVTLDNGFFNWQKRQNLLAMITIVFSVLIPSLVILIFVFRRQADYLEGRVHERTVELAAARDQALEANRRLEELDKLKSDFLASVSHELRTPLTSILGFAKLIRKDFERHFRPLAVQDAKADKKASRIDANVGIIVQEGERLTRLINDVLDLSKIESGRIEWRDEIISVDDLVKQAAEAVNGQFAGKAEVRLRVATLTGGSQIKADRDRMIQVLINLLNNAAKFTEKGEVEISSRRPSPHEVEISVQDTGIGIPTAYLETVFDKFQQVSTDDTLGDKPQGTGLGLPICKQIVEHYRGRMWVESDYGVGSTFFVRLPLATESDTAAPMGPEELPAGSGRADRSGNRILVVDDEPHMRELISQMLIDEGYSVVTAASGFEAIECAREYRPDLVTMDLMMPGMDGYAAIASLHADPLTAAIPIVVISVLSERESAGADAAIGKPIDQQRLYEIIGSLLHEREVVTGECLVVGGDDCPPLTLTLCQERGAVVPEDEMWRRLEAGFAGTVVLLDGHVRERELAEFSRFPTVQLILMPRNRPGREVNIKGESRDTENVT